jgi:hypothetical protein
MRNNVITLGVKKYRGGREEFIIFTLKVPALTTKSYNLLNYLYSYRP